MGQNQNKIGAADGNAPTEAGQPGDIPFFDDDGGAAGLVSGDEAHPDTQNKQPLSLSQQALAERNMGAAQHPAPYLEGLNGPQREAVENLDGPLLVLAGAGTGKTRVLTTRIAHILKTGRARSFQILAVTFTNKAAREMKERVEHLVSADQTHGANEGPTSSSEGPTSSSEGPTSSSEGPTSSSEGPTSSSEGMPWLGTFHAVCVKILRRHAELVGLKSSFTILDMDDQLRLFKQVIEAEGLDPKRWPARQLAALIDGWKNKGITPQTVPKGEAYGFAEGRGIDLYRAYQNRLKELNAADFGDLLLECLRLFREHPDVLAEYQRRFQYLLVDEYQDTNVVQYLWLRLLAQGTSNVCCVGDDDQSIYGWRGAEVDNILRFEKDFHGAKVVRLEQNYRSTGHILGAAAGLISQNQDRLGKTLFTEDRDGDKVLVQSVWDDAEEARTVGDDIEALQQNGHSLSDMAILVRASFQMRAFEDRFVTLGLNYRVVGGPRFYERQEIKDAIAYFDVIFNTANDLRFERIVNTPRRGLGDATLKIVHEYARKEGIPLAQAAANLVETEELKPRPRKALGDLLAKIQHWRDEALKMPHTELAELILDESGYTLMWQKDKSPKAQSRLENLKELVRFMDDFDTMEGFLEHVSLVMDAESDDNGERISLMTLHSAKGLEFDSVFLPGWEEGLFPHQRALDDTGRAGLEEERRLAYVGLTRARQRAKVTFAQNRRMRGLWQASMPSRFVDELPLEHAEAGVAQTAFADMASASAMMPVETMSHPNVHYGARAPRFATSVGNRSRAARPITIEGQMIAANAAPAHDFKLGERVFHQKFGYGQIASIDAMKLTIEFEKAGQKRVLATFVERHLSASG